MVSDDLTKGPNRTADDGAGRLVLIDGSGYAWRSWHAAAPRLSDDGRPVGALAAFVQLLLLPVLTSARAEALAVVFDPLSRRSWRHDLYPSYKSNRPATPSDMALQAPLMRAACRAAGLAVLEAEGWEADDLMAAAAARAEAAGWRTTLVSQDKDLLQLLGPRTQLWDPSKRRRLGVDDCWARFGVLPKRVPDVQALAGDTADGLPGIPGIGVKTAADLVSRYGNLDAVLAAAPGLARPRLSRLLEQHAEEARLTLRLVSLRRDAPSPGPQALLRPLSPSANLPPFLASCGLGLPPGLVAACASPRVD